MLTTNSGRTRKLIIATHNAGKLAEFSSLLNSLPVTLISLTDIGITDEVPESGAAFDENAALKARAYARMTSQWTLADDSGLAVDALDGRPGIYSARYGGGHNVPFPQKWALLLDELRTVPWHERTAQFRCAVALARPDGSLALTADGVCHGQIALEPAGSGGFGFDPLFYLPDQDCTMAELPAAEKDRVSHRARAVRALEPALAQIIGTFRRQTP
ncbi:MAG: RdgB/HAM1 family non-canonical purine NTP pyrophosphatase [Anaerolineales bacterium]